MKNKILGAAMFGAGALCYALIDHRDTANFFAIILGCVGAYEYLLGVSRDKDER